MILIELVLVIQSNFIAAITFQPMQITISSTLMVTTDWNQSTTVPQQLLPLVTPT